MFERWLSDFVESYNKSKERIIQCTKDVNSCKEGCTNKCECVGKWLKIKEEEWRYIKEYYNKHSLYEYKIPYKVKSLFNQGTFPSDAKKAQNVVEGKEKQDELWGCTGVNTDGDKVECKNGDFITNLISKLQDKITSCPNKPDPKIPCDPFPALEDTSTSPDSDAQKPAFCPAEDIPEKPKVPQSDLPGKDKLNTCPYNNDTCNNYRNKKNIGCLRKQHHTDLNHWTNTLIKYDKGKSTDMNHGIFVPPRRRQLCFTNIRPVYRRIKSEETFTEYFLADAYNEAKQLSRYYAKDNEKILEAIKNSFADYGDIFKGTDMLDDGVSNKIKNIFEQKIKKPNNLTSSEQNITPTVWWEQNKIQVWYAMLCGYKDAGGRVTIDDCSLPKEEGTPQFLRWLVEWGKVVCKE